MRFILSIVFLAFSFATAHGQLFTEDFARATDPGPLSPWVVNAGAFSVTGGALKAGPNSLNSFGFAYITNSWTNYLVQGRVRFSSTSADGGGIGGRFNPASGAQYAAWISPENSPTGSRVLQLLKFQDYRIYEYSNITWQMIQEVPLPPVGTNWHNLGVGFQGNQISVYYDSNLVASAVDRESNPIPYGGVAVGLSTANTAYSMYVDDLSVWPLPPTLQTVNDLYVTPVNTALTVPAPGVLSNDVAGPNPNLSATKLSDPSHGTVTLNSNGSFTYTPANNFTGIDTFSYRLSDGVTNTGPATVSVDVTPNGNSFYDNFSRTANSNAFCPWITGVGEWAVTNSQMLGRGTINDIYSDTYVPLKWTDISVQMKFQITANGWACGINARTDPYTGARYVLNIYPENSGLGPPRTLRVIKFHDWEDWNSNYVSMAVVSGLPPIGTSQHTLRGNFYGNKIDVYLDGSLICSVTDTNVDGLAPFRTGCAGVHMYYNPDTSYANFDDFTITALPPVNTAPILPVLPNITTAALLQMTVTNAATDLDPSNTLSYALQTAPAGASIDANGIITWTPAAQQNGTTNLFRTIVTDYYPAATNSQHLTATNTFQVVVAGSNSAPVLGNISNRTIAEFTTLTVTNKATDSDGNTLSYSLLNPPAGASIGTNGVITWTPNEAQGPSTNTITTVATDNGAPALSATNSFLVVVTEVNAPPVLGVIGNQAVAELSTLTVTNAATDPDLPANTLTYSLHNVPSGVTIDANGVITWTPTEAQGPSTNTITTIVSDNGTPNLKATNSFTVVVSNAPPGVNLISYSLAAEGCSPPNQSIDSGETVTMLVALRNSGPGAVTNLIATLQNGNGVSPLTTSQSYGFMPAGGPTVTQAFTFTAVASCGATIQPTFVLTDDSVAVGSVSYTLPLGTLSTVLTQSFDTVSAPALPAGWTTAATGAQPNWVTTTAASATPPNSAFSADANAIGINTLTSPAFFVPNGSAQLSFSHFYDLEADGNIPTNGWDGGVLEIQVGTNAFADILTAGGSFITNGYNRTIDTLWQSPLAGRRAWSGNSGGFITTIVNLPPSSGGKTNLLRWRCGTDNGNGNTGWRLDSIAVSGTFCCSGVSGPLLATQSNRTIPELTLLTVTNSATEVNPPPGGFNYSLLNPPAGASIDTNGVITWTPTEAQGPGTNTITTVVTDTGLPPMSATNSFLVVVTEVNTAPVLSAQTNRTITEAAALSVTNTATDADLPANGLNYSLVNAPAGVNISSTGVITWTPTEAQGPSTNIITTVVTDTGVPPMSATNSFQVAVTEVNTAPVLAVQTNRTIAEGSLLSVTNTATDSDFPVNFLAYSLLNPPAGASISAGGVITWTPTEAQGPGTNTITTVVTDNGVPPLSATNSFQVVVMEVNTAPALSAQTNHTIAEGTSLTVTNAGSDSDIPGNTLSYTLVNAPAGAIISATGVIAWTPTEAQGPSTNTITTIVTDNGVPPLSSTNSFEVVVNEVNSAPVLSAQTNYMVAEGTLLSVTNGATDSDIPANPLSYFLANPPAGVEIDTNGVITWTPAEAQGPSTNTITTIVTDNGVPPLSATNSFEVIVTEVNTAPVLSAQTNHTIAEGTSLSITNRATDSDVPANVLSYALIDPPSGALIDTNGVITWTSTETQGPSTNTIITVVTDDGMPPLSATNSFEVIVTEVNTAPVLPAQTNHTIAEGSSLSITNTATDSDVLANVLSYSLIDPPSGALIDTNGVITWTPTESQGPSTNTIITVVTDDGMPPLTATNSFEVIVTEVNTAPVLSAQTNHTIAEGAPLSVTNAATDSDIPANTLAYTLIDPPTGVVIDTNGVITWTPDESQGPGTNTIITVVTDNGVPPLSCTNSFEVVVAEMNSAPVLPAQTNHAIAEGISLSITNTATDSDVPANVLSYSLIDPPSGVSIDTNGVITWTPDESQGPSTNTITTVVTDDGVPPLSATNTFEVAVNELNEAPVLPAQPNHIIVGLDSIVVTNSASDVDIPLNAMGYQLIGGPTNAAIDLNGVITWSAGLADVPSTNVFVTVATDYNPDAANETHLSATNSFFVIVQEPSAPSPMIRSLVCSNDVARLAWDSVPSRKYAVEYTEDLLNGPWLPLDQPVQAVTNEVEVSALMDEAPQRFYRVVLLP